ncbi:vacuolar sorting protein [Cotonvirus japonicus]|uniref:Vacuolar sorting protein n=1 Tax=Cotonvirus japonicus TaxID=2811091 RepID=A0ABM7NQS0_9VIRU|nr:vacuolar sorting protein [Cotonvirus japonicus]BCS82508.1 vacuolar sorting protein [Cotonvirus japonicus]
MDITSTRWKQKCCCYFVDLLRNYKVCGSLYIDEKLINIISNIIKYSTLLSCGINNIKIIDKTIEFVPKSGIILSHNSKDLFASLTISHNVKLFFYPKIPDFIINREYEIFDFGFIPIDIDILSLEDTNTLNMFGCNGCDTNQLTNYLLDVFNIYGYPSNIQADGNISNTIANITINKTRFDVTNINWNICEEYREQTFENLIIVDRVNDWDNFFQIGSNYESLLDYIYGIRQSRLLIDDNINNAMILNEDVIFQEIKNENFSSVGKILLDKIETIKKFYEDKNNLQTLSEFSDYISQISLYKQQHYSIEKHILICQYIQENLSNHIFKNLIVSEIIPEINIINDSINKISNAELLKYICITLQKNKTPYDKIKDLFDYLPTDDLECVLKKLSIGQKKISCCHKYKMVKTTNTNIMGNTIVFIIGGISYNEIFKIRQTYPKVLILTTNIWNANIFYDAVMKFK